MCGIVGAIARREVSTLLLESLKRLEYRGYDSAGIAVLTDEAHCERIRTSGKVAELEKLLDARSSVRGNFGIAHTRWATHGKPTQDNAHPQMSRDEIALVHNGIIENEQSLREFLVQLGYQFYSDTDSEVIVHLIHHAFQETNDLLLAVQKISRRLIGAFAIAVLCARESNRLIVMRQGSPLVIGIGEGEYFVASDQLALLHLTQNFIHLEEGDIAELTTDQVRIMDQSCQPVERAVHRSNLKYECHGKDEYQHFMLKEIYEQPKVINDTIEGRLSEDKVLEMSLGDEAINALKQCEKVQIVACGTSYHAGLVARYWIEALSGLPCQVEVASEFRYRQRATLEKTLFITISQSGETADTLAALENSLEHHHCLTTFTICNTPGSALVRVSEGCFMTRAGIEIGVASTKAFTTQLASLLMISTLLGRYHGLSAKQEKKIVEGLHHLSSDLTRILELNQRVKKLSEDFVGKHHALFLGRGTQYPIAMEGALKLKEISYIHAEAYPAGELKHGPLALVDQEMPVIVVAPNDELFEKLKSNLHEVRARGGQLYVFADESLHLKEESGVSVINLPSMNTWTTPILYTVPLQLLAYHVALLKGTDIDQPRNLAKSVTVE